MIDKKTALLHLMHGAKFPFDAPDKWWKAGNLANPPEPESWAYEAARGIVADLRDRGGIGEGFEGLDEVTRVEIVKTMAGIIYFAAAPYMD